MMQRRQGSGSIEQHAASGRFLARLPRIYGRTSIGTFDTEEEAAQQLDGAIAELVSRGGAVGNMTLRGFGAMWLDRRELAGHRNMATDRSRWDKHIAAAQFADWPLVNIRRRDVRNFVEILRRKSADDRRGKRKLSDKTVRECLLLLRRCLQDAVDDELIDRNPADKLRVTRTDGKAREEAWTFLTLEEQRAIAQSEKLDEADRLRILFSFGTGLRQGEQWNLELADVTVAGDDPHVVVRYGGPGHQSPKNGKIRKVPLFGVGLDAAKRWLALLPKYAPKNPHALTWPTPSGARRQKSKTYGFTEALAAAGITRPVRWHDLRHTCASSLVAGWWGVRWSLQEAKEVLGHSTVTVTERYAHLSESTIRARAAETTGQRVASGLNGKSGNPERFRWLRGEDLNLRPSGYEPDELPGCSTAQAQTTATGGDVKRAGWRRRAACGNRREIARLTAAL